MHVEQNHSDQADTLPICHEECDWKGNQTDWYITTLKIGIKSCRGDNDSGNEVSKIRDRNPEEIKIILENGLLKSLNGERYENTPNSDSTNSLVGREQINMTKIKNQPCLSSSRYRVGGTPYLRRNARVKFSGLLYPVSIAISVILAPFVLIKFMAF